MARIRVRWIGALPLIAVGCTLPLACSAPSKGALILAVSTDMQTPKDISVLSVFITTDSVVKFDYLGSISDGSVNLPSTLAVVEPDQQGAQVRFRVIGFQNQTARVLRDVLTTVPHQRTALLRLPLDFLDDGSGIGMLPASDVPGGTGSAPDGTTMFDPDTIASKCNFAEQMTSIAGVCATASIDSSTLPDYADDQVFGDGSAAATGCFDVQSCFQTASPVTGLDMGTCSFTLPDTANAATLNLAFATSDQTGAQVGNNYFVPLESDPNEGWTLQGSTVQMVPGVCAKLQSANAQLYVSGGSCAPKVESNPVCQPTVAPLDAGSPGADYCAWVQQIDQMCPSSNISCADQEQTCPSWIGYISTPWLEAYTSCFTPATYCAQFEDGGDSEGNTAVEEQLLSCVFNAFSNTPLTATENQLAADFCKQCPDGASSAYPKSCSTFWWTCVGGSSSTEGPDGATSSTCSQCFNGPSSCSGESCPGTCGGVADYSELLLAYSDSALAKIDQQCTGGAAQADGAATDCALAFAQCAQTVADSLTPQCDGGTGGSDAAAAVDSSTTVPTTTFACYVASQDTCTEELQVPQSEVASLQAACAADGGTAGQTCPVANESGCCIQQGGGTEECVYNQDAAQLSSDQTSCKTEGGVWQATQ